MKTSAALATLALLLALPGCGEHIDPPPYTPGGPVNENPTGGGEQPGDDDGEPGEDDGNGEDEVTACSPAATRSPLQPGDCVPDFTLPAQDGVTQVTLSDHIGQWVLLSSYPMANTPVCTAQMQKLDELYDEFIDSGIQPFGFNNESPEIKGPWAEQMGIEKLLLLSDHDPRNAVSDMFGIVTGFTVRANTVIGPDGTFVMTRPVDGPADIPAILAEIRALQEQE